MTYTLALPIEDRDRLSDAQAATVTWPASGRDLVAWFVAAYAAGDWPDSQRARRWFSVPDELATALPLDRSRASMQALIAYRDAHGTAVHLEAATVARALYMRPTRCEVLHDLGQWLRIERRGDSALPVDLVRRLARVLPRLSVRLSTSVHYDKLSDVIAAVYTAERLGTHLEIERGVAPESVGACIVVGAP